MNFPVEIYLNIFQFLDRYELEKCVQVCRAWSLPAIQIYYKSLFLNSTRVAKIKSLIDNGHHFKHCHHVKILTVHQTNATMDDTQIFSKREFLTLFSYLPNLRQIRMYPNRESLNYFSYLLEISLHHLEQINVRNHLNIWRPAALHYSVYHHFCHSLTHLSVIYQPGSEVFAQYGGILNYLHNFKNLLHLSYYDNTGEPLTIYQILDACPSLKAINFRSHNRILGVPNVANAKTLCFSKLEKLSMYFPSLSAGYVKYATEHLPTSVKKADIVMNDVYLYDWINDIGIGAALKFIERYSKLDHVEIKWTLKDEEEELDNHYPSTMTIFFSLLHAFIRGRNVFCSARFDESLCAYNGMSFIDEQVHFNYGLKFEDLYGDDRSVIPPILNFAVPNTSVSITGPEIINELTFYISSMHHDIACKLLKYSLINCPYLQYAKFLGMECDSRFVLSESVNFNHRKMMNKLNIFNTAKTTLKVLQLWNFIPSQEFLDLVSFNLPNIHTITCLEAYYDTAIYYQPDFWVVDLTKFENLEIFYFGVQLVLQLSNHDFCFINFKYSDNENVYYQYNGKEDLQLRPISLEYFLNSNHSPTALTILFRCKKIKQFSIWNSDRQTIVDILEGIPQSARLDKSKDIPFLSACSY